MPYCRLVPALLILVTAALQPSLAKSPRPIDSCAPMRHLLPQDVTCTAEAPLPAATWEASTDAGHNGLVIGLEISRDGRAFRSVPLSTPICSGDRLALRVRTGQRGYVHILNGGTSGRWAKIFSGNGPVDPRDHVRVPASGQGFPVTGPPGTEHVLLFVSSKPFSAPLRQTLARLDHRGGRLNRGDLDGITPRHLRDIGPSVNTHVATKGQEAIAFSMEHRARCGGLP